MSGCSAMSLGARQDLALQIAAVRELAARMPPVEEANEQPDDLLPPHRAPDSDLPGSSVNERTWPHRTLFVEEELQQRLEWARGLRPDAAGNVLRALERARELGAERRIAVPGSSKDFDQLRASFPHFGEVCDFVWRRAVLAGSAGDCAFRIPPILLNGPPGVGKTEFAQRLAGWLGTPMTRVDMGGLDTSFKLTGLDSGYSTGRPGAIWDALQGPWMSPVVLLDELDKRSNSTGDSGVAFLLALLEPSTATRFEDSCLGLAINASWIQWIATSNDTSSIDTAMLTRFRVFNINEPTGDEGRAVVESVFNALRNREAWAQAFPEQLPGHVTRQLVGRSAREVRQALEEACANAVICGRRELQPGDVPPRPGTGRKRMGFTP